MKKLLYAIIIIWFTTIVANAENNLDANWMNGLDPTLKVNQIHIPGTHDSGSYAINVPFLELFTETQALDIIEQLESGIRYFDIKSRF